MDNRDGPVTFIVPGDLHLTEAGIDNHRAALRVIDEVNNLIRPDFVQFIGDNVQDATEAQFRLFDELRGGLAVPHFALVGDHDVHDDPEGRGYSAHLGPTYGATILRGFRFLRLDTQQARPVGVSAEQVAWFGRQVDEALGAGQRVVVFQHNYPYQIWETFDGPGIDAWRAVVQTRRIAALVCGHTHYWQVANDGRNVVVATRSIGEPEGGPAGYTIGHAEAEDLAFAFRPVDEEGPLVLVAHPREVLLATGPEHVVSGPDRVVVRVWSESPPLAVRGRIDGGPWRDFDPIAPGTWSGPLPGDRLGKGEHTCEAEARDGLDRVGSRRITFVVDPTGRYTAVPRVEPLVRSTSFC